MRPRSASPEPPRMLRTAAVLALAGTAAAFSPMMSRDLGRHKVVQVGAAAAAAVPLLRPTGAKAKGDLNLQSGAVTLAEAGDEFANKEAKNEYIATHGNQAPDIAILDHRGCSRKVWM